jgi:hypothetical protein
MASSTIYPPPSTAHRDCAICNEHYLSVDVQRNGDQGYFRSLGDHDAQALLLSLRDATDESLEHVKNMLMSHGDVIHSRWKKLTQEKRAKVLAAASDLFQSSPARSAWHMERNALVNWADITSFSQDSMKLLSLLHVRTSFESRLWAAFDTRSSSVAFAAPKQMLYMFNAASVIMHGEHYGRLVELDVESAHGWEDVGFPRAVITFQAQFQISDMLKSAVNLLVADAAATGNSKWTTLVSEGLHSAHEGALWSSYHNQEFAPPTSFDPDTLLEKARNHSNILIDEIELMQTNPEYMRQNVLDVKKDIRIEANESADKVWARVARTYSLGWTNEIVWWQRVMAECEHLKVTLAKCGVFVAAGARLPKEADTAMRCFGETIHASLAWAATMEFRCLHQLAAMRESFNKFDKFVVAKSAERTGANRQLEEFLDLSKRSDRVLFVAYTISCVVSSTRPREIFWYIQRLKSELSGLAYGKSVENWLSGMALLDELYVSWQWRQMTDYHDPLGENILALEIKSRDMLPSDFEFGSKENMAAMRSTAGDRECGQMMRTFCEIPQPRGAKNLTWLRKMTESRRHLTETWRFFRAGWNDRQLDVGRSELFRAGVLSCISFDESPEYLARVETERQQIEKDDKCLRIVREEQQRESQFVRQA